MNIRKIPEGYKENAKGGLDLIVNIKEIDLLRDELVVSIATRSREKSSELAEFKMEVMEEIQAFVKASADRFKARLGGAKGNLTLISYDGRYKVLVQQQDSIRFDERLQVAKSLVDKCVKKWSDGANAYLLVLVNDAFQVDRSGNLSAGRVLGLRRHDIDDIDWRRAMDAISESVQVTGSKTYFRAYERDEHGEYRPISLDMAGV